MSLLEELHKTYQKWFHLKDTTRLDVVLAVALSRELKGTPLWLIIVSNSGDMKSEQLMALNDEGMNKEDGDKDTVKIIHRFTPKTLVNGNPTVPDLAPELKDKIVIVPDFAQLLSLHPNDKTQVWAQLRDLYDGNAGVQSGMGKDVRYKDIRVTFLAGSTPAIDDQILIHQSLGTRELLYRPHEQVSMLELMTKVWQNEDVEEEMRREIHYITRAFIDMTHIKPIKISNEAEKTIMNLSCFLTFMRASASLDFSGELRGFVYPEKPTRILKQLKRLFIALMSLDDDYPESLALEIIKDVVMSSCDQTRTRVLDVVIDHNNRNKELTTSMVSDILKIGKKTAKTELCIMWNEGLLNRVPVMNETPWGEERVLKELWYIVPENETIRFVINGFKAVWTQQKLN